MALSEQTIERIKALNVSSVLESNGVFLKRVGREFVTHCIWHKDKNPSLTVSDEKGFVFCHVCREGGDVIHYVGKKFGLNFRESCEKIASQFNIQTIYEDEDSESFREKKHKIEELLSDCKIKQEAFRSNLKTSLTAVNFLKTRNIKPETSRSFGLGYDPNLNRLTIPIKDYKGSIVGFTGRAIGDQLPKYKNTENNLIFNKSELVFNEYDSIEAIRAQDECIFVEGHIDVIAMWQEGITNVVALQGTASPSHAVVTRLTRRTNRFVLCMDADEGGEKAIGLFLKSVQDLALNGKIDIKIASIPQGKDPDEAIKLGVKMQDVIASSIPWIDWILDKWLIGLDFNDTTKIQEVETKIKDLISKLSSSALRAHYLDKAAICLARNKQNVAIEILKNLKADLPASVSKKCWSRPSVDWTRMIAEKRLLRLYIHKADMRDYLKPLMCYLSNPDMIWLWERIEELEANSSVDCTPFSIMALLAVAEPRYLQKLRTLARPTIQVDDNPMVLAHIEDTLVGSSKVH